MDSEKWKNSATDASKWSSCVGSTCVGYSRTEEIYQTL